MRGVTARVVFGLLFAFVFTPLSFAYSTNEMTSKTTGSRTTGFIKIGENRELFVDYQRPVPGRPIVVILNGLTYRVGIWDKFVAQLEGDGLGILRYDPMGQGATLLKYAPPKAAYELEKQVEDLGLLLNKLEINQPVHILTLSYGSAVGMGFAVEYPARIASLILMAPFVAPLDSQDRWIRMQIRQTRLLYPYNPASDDELYDYFLRILIYATYPAAEPIVLENPYKLEATFRLVQGARKFRAKDIAHRLPPEKVHFMIARKDQYVANEIHEEFWTQVPASAKASRIFIESTEHKIPEAAPRFSAAWVKRIIAGDKRIQGGATFVGAPWSGWVESDTTRFNVYKAE